MTGQTEIDVAHPGTRRYWEHAGPLDWRPVVVRVRYGSSPALPQPAFPLVVTASAAPRNVLVERADGTSAVRPVQRLRLRCPRQGVA